MRRRTPPPRKARVSRDALSSKRRRRAKALKRMLAERDFDEAFDDSLRAGDPDPWAWV